VTGDLAYVSSASPARRRSHRAAAVLLTIGLVPGLVGGWLLHVGRAAGVPAIMGPMTYAGTLYDGNTPAEGTRKIEIVLWDDAVLAASADRKCSTVVPTVPVTGGHFRITLDSSCNAPAQVTPNLWTEVLVGDVSLGRTSATAVPYAVQAGSALQAGSVPWTGVTAASGDWPGSIPLARVTGLQASISNPVVTRKGRQYSLGATFCGVTATPTSGAIFNGYLGAKTSCEGTSACGNSPSAHMCSAEEVVRSMAVGIAPPTTPAWYSAGFLSGGGGALFDCAGWTTASGASYGWIWPNVSLTALGYDSCGAQHVIACCD
jgi:hypothetical protein